MDKDEQTNSSVKVEDGKYCVLLHDLLTINKAFSYKLKGLLPNFTDAQMCPDVNMFTGCC